VFAAGPRSALVLLLLVVAWGPVVGQQSSHFQIRRFSVTPIAGPSSSENFQGRMNFSMVTGSAGVCPSGTATTLGFWSILGPRTLPVVLTAAKNEHGLSEIVLAWSGQADEFTLYRSKSPVDVVHPRNVLLTTGVCEKADASSGLSDLFFYKVIRSSPATP